MSVLLCVIKYGSALGHLCGKKYMLESSWWYTQVNVMVSLCWYKNVYIIHIATLQHIKVEHNKNELLSSCT